MITLAVWLLALPLRIAFALGLRRTVALVCVFVLAVTLYGVAEDLDLLEPPARAAPAHRTPARNPAAGQPAPSRAATAYIPAGYLRLYGQAGARYQIPWSVLAAIGKVESDHGRARLPGVRSGWNHAGAAGPMQFGIGVGRAGNAWATYGRDFDRDGRTSVYDPGDAIPAAAGYLRAHGAPRRLDPALYAYNHSWAYVARVKQLARRYAARGDGWP
jgi:membrane-bound lytic murein transglycosylase B